MCRKCEGVREMGEEDGAPSVEIPVLILLQLVWYVVRDSIIWNILSRLHTNIFPYQTHSTMMKAAVLATLAGSAVAFAPTQQAARTSTAVSATEAQRDFFGITGSVTGGADFSKELGVQPPVSFYLQKSSLPARM